MDNSKLLEFLQKAGELKNMLRFKESEKMPKDTTASHSWRTALLSFILIDELQLDLDTDKVLRMAIIHDIVEAEIGNTDFTSIAKGKISKEEQGELEKKAIIKLTQILPEKSGKEILDLWIDFDKRETKEAKYVRTINKLETLIYLLEVGRAYYSNPSLIFDYIKSANEVSELNDIFNEVKKRLEKEINVAK